MIQHIKKALKKLLKLLLPFRGHSDSTKIHPEVGKSGLTNSGNFAVLYRVRGGDKIFENHLQNAPQNARHISPDIQNELIKCCRDLTVEQLAGRSE